MKTLALPFVAIVLAACATPEASRQPGASTVAEPQSKVSQAVTAPLSDLNLVRAEIPSALVTAQKAPYALPVDRSCAGLANDVKALDAVLGADLDTPATASNPGLIERGTTAAGDAAIGALRSAAEGAIPYRGWVRKLTGAERYSKEVAAAIASGTVRRAFLKGMARATDCPSATMSASSPT